MKEKQKEENMEDPTMKICISEKEFRERAEKLNQKMKDRELHKIYLCLVHGKPKKDSDILEGYLVKDEKKNKFHLAQKECIHLNIFQNMKM